MRQAKAEVVELDVREAGAGDGAGGERGERGEMSRTEVAFGACFDTLRHHNVRLSRGGRWGLSGASCTERMHNGCLITNVSRCDIDDTEGERVGPPVAQILR